MNKTKEGKKQIELLIESGVTNKQQIYSKLVEIMDIKRPTARRIAREFLIDLTKKIEIITNKQHKTIKSNYRIECTVEFKRNFNAINSDEAQQKAKDILHQLGFVDNQISIMHVIVFRNKPKFD